MSNTERWRNLELSGVPILGNYINFNGEKMRNSLKEFKKELGKMKGLEWFNWFILKPIALILIPIVVIVLNSKGVI